MPRVIHFEIHAGEPERAVTFYSQLLGWHFHKWEGPADYWLIETGPNEQPGINGGMVQRQGGIEGDMLPVTSYVCTVDVENLDSTLAKAQELGGTVAVPKMPVPGIGWLAYAKDTEGNIFGMMQTDPSASM